jgi:hypothetical protein
MLQKKSSRGYSVAVRQLGFWGNAQRKTLTQILPFKYVLTVCALISADSMCTHKCPCTKDVSNSASAVIEHAKKDACFCSLIDMLAHN